MSVHTHGDMDSSSKALWMRRWTILDWALALYTVYVSALLLVTRSIPEWWILLFSHGGFLVVLAALPARGGSWEMGRAEPGWRATLRGAGVILRYLYPLIVVLLFFEEGQFIINLVYPDSPYWFEKYLYAADQWIFGTHPSIFLLPYRSRPLDELMHFFYFSYFLILIFGPLIGRMPPRGSLNRKWGFTRPEFESALTCMILGFLCAFVWYPWIPARGPFENVELIAAQPPFEGGLFTAWARGITDGAYVSGNCFPSAHVAGTWGVTFGLLFYYRRIGLFMAVVAVGVSISCFYTRYHHFVDVPAGFLMGLLGTGLFWCLRRLRS
jgi:membrane-associated phospholipid phosphatase